MENQSEKELQKIQDYLSGQLSPDDQKAFEEKIATNKELESTVSWYRALFQVVEEQEDLRIKKLLRNEQTTQNTINSPLKLLWKQRWSIAVSLLALIGFFWWWSSPSDPLIPPSDPPKDEFKEAPLFADVISKDLITTRSNQQENTDTNLIKTISTKDALQLKTFYESQAFDQALAILDTLPESTSILFYKANSYIALEQYEKAIPLLKKVEADQAENFSNFAQWYLAFAYFHANNLDSAKIYARKTIDNEGIYDADRAKAKILLEEIQ